MKDFYKFTTNDLIVEDYQAGEAGIASFQDSLRQFINLSLGLKENGKGFAVIQKPFAVKDDAVNATIMLYCKAVDEVVKEYEDESEKLDRIVVVDHFAQTNQDDFKNNKLKDGQTLNAAGHFEIGKQFSAATIKTTDSYPGNGVTLNLKEEEQPERHSGITGYEKALRHAGLQIKRGDSVIISRVYWQHKPLAQYPDASPSF